MADLNILPMIGQIYRRTIHSYIGLIVVTDITSSGHVHFNNYPAMDWPDSLQIRIFNMVYERHISDLDFYKDILDI